MTDISNDTLKQIRAARVQTMSRVEKIGYLKRAGWRNVDGNRWRNRDGVYTTFASADAWGHRLPEDEPTAKPKLSPAAHAFRAGVVSLLDNPPF